MVTEATLLLGLVVAIVGLVIAIVVAIIESSARYNVVIKGHLPFCPRCGRQVSYRRGHCRACGFTIKHYGLTPGQVAQAQAEAARDKAESERRAALAAEAERLRARRRAAELEEWRRKKREALEEYYRSRGVEPGPWAWFQVWPAWAQSVAIGMVIAFPLVIVMAFVFSPRGVRPSRQAGERPRIATGGSGPRQDGP